MEKLDDCIKAHDKDIERMCNHHYQGFIDSIRELLQVRSQAQQLNVSFIFFKSNNNNNNIIMTH